MNIKVFFDKQLWYNIGCDRNKNFYTHRIDDDAETVYDGKKKVNWTKMSTDII